MVVNNRVSLGLESVKPRTDADCSNIVRKDSTLDVAPAPLRKELELGVDRLRDVKIVSDIEANSRRTCERRVILFVHVHTVTTNIYIYIYCNQIIVRWDTEREWY